MSDVQETALIEAIRNNNIGKCKRLIEDEGVDVHEKDEHGWSCLMWACSLYSLYGNFDIAEYLISRGANIHDKDNAGWSSLMEACYDCRVDVAEYLMSKGASIYDVSNHDGLTCFSVARINKKVNILSRLRKWPTTMAIIILQELALIYIIDSESIIDLHQYLGRPDDCSKSDDEREYGDLN